MSISLLSNAWQPSPAELASFYADGTTASSAPTSAPTSAASSAASTSSSAAQPTSGVSFAQIASELQTILLQLQEGGAPAATPAGSNSAGTGTSQTASTDPGTGTSSATGEVSDTHHHHHHRAGDATQQAGASTAGSTSGVAANADLANALASLTI